MRCSVRSIAAGRSTFQDPTGSSRRRKRAARNVRTCRNTPKPTAWRAVDRRGSSVLRRFDCCSLSLAQPAYIQAAGSDCPTLRASPSRPSCGRKRASNRPKVQRVKGGRSFKAYRVVFRLAKARHHSLPTGNRTVRAFLRRSPKLPNGWARPRSQRAGQGGGGRPGPRNANAYQTVHPTPAHRSGSNALQKKRYQPREIRLPTETAQRKKPQGERVAGASSRALSRQGACTPPRAPGAARIMRR